MKKFTLLRWQIHWFTRCSLASCGSNVEIEHFSLIMQWLIVVLFGKLARIMLTFVMPLFACSFKQRNSDNASNFSQKFHYPNFRIAQCREITKRKLEFSLKNFFISVTRIKCDYFWFLKITQHSHVLQAVYLFRIFDWMILRDVHVVRVLIADICVWLFVCSWFIISESLFDL